MKWHTRVPQAAVFVRLCVGCECHASARWCSCAPAPVYVRVCNYSHRVIQRSTTTVSTFTVVVPSVLIPQPTLPLPSRILCLLPVLLSTINISAQSTRAYVYVCVWYRIVRESTDRDTHRGYTESVYTHSAHTRQRGRARQKRDGLCEGSERDGQGGSKQDRCWPQQPLTRQYYFQPFSGANATRRGVVSQPSSQS